MLKPDTSEITKDAMKKGNQVTADSSDRLMTPLPSLSNFLKVLITSSAGIAQLEFKLEVACAAQKLPPGRSRSWSKKTATFGSIFCYLFYSKRTGAERNQEKKHDISWSLKLPSLPPRHFSIWAPPTWVRRKLNGSANARRPESVVFIIRVSSAR